MSVSPDRNVAAIAESEGFLSLYRRNRGSPIFKQIGLGIGESVNALAVSPDGGLVVIPHTAWRFENAYKLTQERQMDFGSLRVWDLEFAPSGEIFAAVGNGLQIYDTEPVPWRSSNWEKPEVDLRIADRHFEIVRFSPDGKDLVVAGNNWPVQILDVEKLQQFFSESRMALVDQEFRKIGVDIDSITSIDRRLESIRKFRAKTPSQQQDE